MLTIDLLLHQIIDLPNFQTNLNISLKNKKILISLSRQIKKGYFFTENQGNLLIKILKENQKILEKENNLDLNIVNTPNWSQSFRIVNVVRKIYFQDEKDTKIVVEVDYDKHSKQRILELSKSFQGDFVSVSPNKFIIESTEKNILSLINSIDFESFNIEERIVKLYQRIKNIYDQGTENLNISSSNNEKIINYINTELTNKDTNLDLIMLDRRHRYQYSLENNTLENTLSFKIANRQSTNIWINQSNINLNNLVTSLHELSRFPVLVIFDKHQKILCHHNLLILYDALKDYPSNKVGIYFRVDNNSEENKNFNLLIGKLGYNNNLDNDTSVVGINFTTLPKFMLTSSWYPRTVISFTNLFKHSKAAAYCDAVDLVIYYNNNRPIIGKIHDIV